MGEKKDGSFFVRQGGSFGVGNPFFECLSVFCFIPGIYIFYDWRLGVNFGDSEKDSFLVPDGLDGWRKKIDPYDRVEGVGETEKRKCN